MSEMLANYHFIVRNYCRAVPQLEAELKKQPSNMLIKKKLIICYTQTDKLTKALKLFVEVLHEDIDLIIDTDYEYEDCPCPDLISMLESGAIKRDNKFNLLLELGILWLYCDSSKSLDYFLRAKETDTKNKSLQIIIDLIQLTQAE